MALHRSKPLCSACHSRMDPLGLALDNFNPLGIWREQEEKQPIDASGKLITGESFHDVRDLKKILKERHRVDFYRCVTEKLLTYALGRGLEYDDVETVDRIVERLDRDGGRFSALLMGVIESAPFQKRRNPVAAAAAEIRRRLPDKRSDHPTRQSRPGGTHEARPFARRTARRPAARQPEPPPLPQGGGRLDGAAGLRVAACPGACRGRGRGRRRCRRPRATGAPLRMAFVYVPNGVNQSNWWPKKEGKDFELNRTMQPLERVKSQIQVIAGLDQQNAFGGKDGPGDHARACATFLTGVRVKKTAGADIHAGVSIDQVAAQRGRPPHAVPLARAGLRRRPQVGELRLRLLVRLPVQPLVGLAHACR